MDFWVLGVVVWLIFGVIVWLVAWLICCLLGLVLCRRLAGWLRLPPVPYPPDHVTPSAPEYLPKLGLTLIRPGWSRPWLARGP